MALLPENKITRLQITLGNVKAEFILLTGETGAGIVEDGTTVKTTLNNATTALYFPTGAATTVGAATISGTTITFSRASNSAGGNKYQTLLVF